MRINWSSLITPYLDNRLFHADHLPRLREQVTALEICAKRTHKWANTSVGRREVYLSGLQEILSAAEASIGSPSEQERVGGQPRWPPTGLPGEQDQVPTRLEGPLEAFINKESRKPGFSFQGDHALIPNTPLGHWQPLGFPSRLAGLISSPTSSETV